MSFGHENGGWMNDDQRADPTFGGSRIADDTGQPNHGEAGEFFNQLIIDMKKQMLGHPHEPITMERLNEGTRHIFELDKCRRPTKFYRGA